MWRKSFACRTPKATNIYSEHVTLGILLFHFNNGCTNMPQCYVIRKMAVLFKLHFHESNETFRAVTLILPIWLQGGKTLQHVSVAQDINHVHVNYKWCALHERTSSTTEFLVAKWVENIQEKLKFPRRRRRDTDICCFENTKHDLQISLHFATLLSLTQIHSVSGRLYCWLLLTWDVFREAGHRGSTYKLLTTLFLDGAEPSKGKELMWET